MTDSSLVRGRFGTFEALREQTMANGNLLAVTMGELRAAHGATKLGVRIRGEIAEQLAGVGLGFFPGDELPSYQEQPVRIYRRGTQIGAVVEAVLRPTAGGDELLRDTAANEAAVTLKQIRAIVCND